MQCSSPKRLSIKKNNTLYTIYVPCGHCYACQCQQRAEWALRCDYELKKYKYTYFVTLTYDNKHLPHTLSNNQFTHLVNMEMLKPEAYRRWNFARLNPQHASKLLRDLQRYTRKFLIESACCLEPEKFLWRFFLTGEYGDVTNRPHMHILLFSHLPFTKSDIEKIFAKCWKYGHVDIDVTHDKAASINYVAKHQVKSCEGCEEQKKESPIFKRVSRYKGGLGYNMKNDLVLRHRFFDDDSEKFIPRQQGQIEYKLAYPRYLRKHYINRTMEEYELSELENTSKASYYEQIEKVLIECPSLFDTVKKNDVSDLILSVRRYCRNKDKQIRMKYEKKRLLKYINKKISHC